MAKNVALYETLKPHVGQEAAGMIAEVVPSAGELLTKSYLDARVAEVNQRIAKGEARISRRLLAYFIPLWVIELVRPHAGDLPAVHAVACSGTG